jgi:D-arabinan exo alpha-(1,3)/(1,5)-arabinofuranosidase (non-reducing end)
MKRAAIVLLVIWAACQPCRGQSIGANDMADLFRKPKGVVTRWSSFENLTANPGKGGQENQGAKGHAFDAVAPGETKVLLDVKGSGTVRRMWCTLRPRDPKVLRSLRLDMYWDSATKPAVSVPIGDFFNWVHGHPVAFESALFANPEARSFVCFIPMPFRTAAKITLTNESQTPIPHLFYDINVTLGDRHEEDVLYFHATWQRERPTTLGEDFAILPRVEGAGRFLGCHVGVIANTENIGWWGEGEVKAYLDDDEAFPTLCGTGTEDYIATAWGQGEYGQRYHGCLLADKETQRFSFYRYHIPDPVYFDKSCRVTIQQIGGTNRKEVVEMLDQGVPIKPISADDNGRFVKLLEPGNTIDLRKDIADSSWVNYYRQDDVCAVAFFYLDSPTSDLPPLAGVEERIQEMQ